MVTINLTPKQYELLMRVFDASDQSHEEYVEDHRDYYDEDEQFYLVHERLDQRAKRHLWRQIKRQIAAQQIPGTSPLKTDWPVDRLRMAHRALERFNTNGADWACTLEDVAKALYGDEVYLDQGAQSKGLCLRRLACIVMCMSTSLAHAEEIKPSISLGAVTIRSHFMSQARVIETCASLHVWNGATPHVHRPIGCNVLHVDVATNTGTCDVYMPQPEEVDDQRTALLGHEVLHCLEGDYHQQDDL